MAKCVIEYLKDKCNKKTSTYHHGNLKEELLKLSVEIIETKGVDTLTLQVLATQLGTSRSAIYRHFKSKDELIHNVILFAFEMFDNIIAPIFMKKEINVKDRLYEMGKSYIQFSVDHANLYRMLFGEKFQEIREDACDIEDEDQATGFHALVGLLIEGQENNTFKKMDAMLQAQAVHCIVHGIASLHIDGHLHITENINELYEINFQIMTQGLLK